MPTDDTVELPTGNERSSTNDRPTGRRWPLHDPCRTNTKILRLWIAGKCRAHPVSFNKSSLRNHWHGKRMYVYVYVPAQSSSLDIDISMH